MDDSKPPLRTEGELVMCGMWFPIMEYGSTPYVGGKMAAALLGPHNMPCTNSTFRTQL